MWRTASWTAQALLAYCAVLIAVAEPAAAQQVNIIDLYWQSDILTLVTDQSLVAGEVRILVHIEGVGETAYIAQTSGENSATFALPVPLSGQKNEYELLVVDDAGNPLQKGLVAFTLMGELITCGPSQFCRITNGWVNSTCLMGSSPCYIGAPSTAHIYDLDPVNNPELVVHVPTSVFPNTTATVEDVSADILTYEEPSASFHIAHELKPPIMLTELLSRAEGREDLMVSACDGDVCTLDTFTMSSTNYELCGVFLDSDISLVTNVGVTTFQDLNLIVDTPDVPINFRFVKPPGDGIFEVYHGNVSAFDSDPKKLDCSRVPDNSFCYGAVIELSTYIAVTYLNKVNSVVAPVPQQQKFHAGH